MSNPSALGAVEYEAESTFGEDVTTFATLRLPICSPVDVSGLSHTKVDTNRTQQYRQGGFQWLLGAMGGTFTTEMYFPGHGSTTSGATTVTALETLFGLILGNATVSASSGTTFTGGTASVPLTTASATYAAGSIGFAGVLGDARGNGQAFVVGTHPSTTMNLLTAIGASPSAADVCYSAFNIYPSENPTSTTVSSVRMRVLTANLRYELHGCVPTAVTFTGFNPGEFLKAKVTWSPAWWRYTTATFPSTLATDSTLPAVNAAGSFFLNDVGTATRATRVYRDLSIDYTLGMELELGPGGVNIYQQNVSARRTLDSIKWSWTEDADAATTTPVLPGYGVGTTAKHGLLTLSTTAGARVAVYSPNLCVSNVTLQRADKNINRLRIEAMAYTGATTTSDLTLSAIRFGLA